MAAQLADRRLVLLVRHGKPALPPTRRVDREQFRLWLDTYDRAVIETEPAPSAELVEAVASCGVVVSSPLPRAVASVDRLGAHPRRRSLDPLLRECPVPLPPRFLPALPPMTMVTLMRVAWLLRLADGSESFVAARKRAEQVTDRIEALVERDERVAVIGHGIMNWLVASALRERGWVGPQEAGKKYWGREEYRPGGTAPISWPAMVATAKESA